MARVWSRIAAITARRAGADSSWPSGDVVFTHGTSLARFTSPLAHEAPIAAPHADYAGAIAETASGAVARECAKPRPARISRSKLWKPGAAALQTVLAESGENLVEPVLVAPRTGPSVILPGCTIGTMPICWRSMRASRAKAI